MLFKAITLFLVFIAVLAMFGRLRVPGRGPRCPDCGKRTTAGRPCACRKRG
jgi:hypothetical protein